VTDASDRERLLVLLFAKRAAVMERPSNAARETILRALDEMIARVQSGAFSVGED